MARGEWSRLLILRQRMLCRNNRSSIKLLLFLPRPRIPSHRQGGGRKRSIEPKYLPRPPPPGPFQVSQHTTLPILPQPPTHQTKQRQQNHNFHSPRNSPVQICPHLSQQTVLSTPLQLRRYQKTQHQRLSKLHPLLNQLQQNFPHPHRAYIRGVVR